MKGFSLLETLISLSLGLLIIIGIYTIYQSSAQTYRYLQALIYLQENGQMAAYLLRRELSMVNYGGCQKMQTLLVEKNPTIDILKGYNAQNVNQLSISVTKQIRPATDAVLVRYLSPHKHMQVSCYDTNLVAGDFVSSLFYIGKTERVDAVGNPIFALYVHHAQDRDEELIENVDNMQLRYGIKKPDGKLIFYSAEAVTNWSRIQAIAIELLLSSGDPILNKPQHIIWTGKDEIAADRRLYKTWNIIVGLPNQ